MAKSEQEKLAFFQDLFREAVSSNNPAQSIVDAIDSLKESDLDLWNEVNSIRSQMLQSMNNMNTDDRADVLRQFLMLSGNKKEPTNE